MHIFEFEVRGQANRFINLGHICSVGEAEVNKDRSNDWVEVTLSSGEKYVVNMFQLGTAYSTAGVKFQRLQKI